MNGVAPASTAISTSMGSHTGSRRPARAAHFLARALSIIFIVCVRRARPCIESLAVLWISGVMNTKADARAVGFAGIGHGSTLRLALVLLVF